MFYSTVIIVLISILVSGWVLSMSALETKNVTHPFPSTFLESGAIIFTVAKDGTANFTSITDAISSVPSDSTERSVIRIRKGIYKENLVIPKWKMNIVLVGEGSDSTIITGNRAKDDHWTTYTSATLVVQGFGFLARDITIENTAGPLKEQAVALTNDADLSALYRCSIKGYQDTLYVGGGRQFYRECSIWGTIDYIFGNARAVIQASQIVSRLPREGQFIAVTAQANEEEVGATAISLQNCSIVAGEDLKRAGWKVKAFLGRPWKRFSTTAIMESFIDDFISPQGWTLWDENNTAGLDTVFYGEYKNYGPGSNTAARFKAAGIHAAMDPIQAAKFTVSQLLQGDDWLPSTSIPYQKGLS